MVLESGVYKEKELFPAIPKPKRFRKLSRAEKRDVAAEIGASTGGATLAIVSVFGKVLPFGGILTDAAIGAGVGWFIGARGFDLAERIVR